MSKAFLDTKLADSSAFVGSRLEDVDVLLLGQIVPSLATTGQRSTWVHAKVPTLPSENVDPTFSGEPFDLPQLGESHDVVPAFAPLALYRRRPAAMSLAHPLGSAIESSVVRRTAFEEFAEQHGPVHPKAFADQSGHGDAVLQGDVLRSTDEPPRAADGATLIPMAGDEVAGAFGRGVSLLACSALPTHAAVAPDAEDDVVALKGVPVLAMGLRLPWHEVSITDLTMPEVEEF